MGVGYFNPKHAVNQADSLPIRKELLLLRVLDGEASWLERAYAKRLLAKNLTARAFFEALKDLSCTLRANYSVDLADPNDRSSCLERGIGFDAHFCERVMARIAEEEQRAIYTGALTPGRRSRLGVRSAAGGSASWWLPSIDRLSWGLSGAAVAVMLSVTLFDAPLGGNNLLARSFEGASEVQLASQSTSASGSAERDGRYSSTPRPLHAHPGYPSGALAAVSTSDAGTDRRVFDPRFELTADEPGALEVDAVEVDWVRSPGRVRVLHNRESRSAIIWVRRPQALPYAGGLTQRVLPTASELDNLQAPQQYIADSRGRPTRQQSAQALIPRAIPWVIRSWSSSIVWEYFASGIRHEFEQFATNLSKYLSKNESAGLGTCA